MRTFWSLLTVLLLLPASILAQCPLAQDSLTDTFGKKWQGKISDKIIWPNIQIDLVGGGGYKAPFNTVMDLKWEGVTNAKVCYLDPGIEACREADRELDAFRKAPEDEDKRKRSIAQYESGIELLSNIKEQADSFGVINGVRPFEQSRPHLDHARKTLAALKFTEFFNRGSKQFQEALALKDPKAIGDARLLIKKSKAEFKAAIEWMQPQLPGMNQAEFKHAQLKIQTAREKIVDGDRIDHYVAEVAKVFERQNLPQAESFKLEKLLDQVEKNQRTWESLSKDLGRQLGDGQLKELLDAQIKRAQEARQVLAGR